VSLYKKILIPTDGSETANRAVEHGVELAAAVDAEVYGVYIIDISAFAGIPTEVVWEKMKSLLQDESEKALQRIKDKAEEKGLKSKEIVKEGVPAEEIIGVAKEEGVDLIVMGTSGRTGLDKFLLGSVAEKVLRTSPCPVLIIHK